MKTKWSDIQFIKMGHHWVVQSPKGQLFAQLLWNCDVQQYEFQPARESDFFNGRVLWTLKRLERIVAFMKTAEKEMLA